MGVAEQRLYRAKLKRSNMTDGERLLEMVKSWFRWRQGKLNGYGPFKKFLEDMEKPQRRLRKRQGCNILLGDPKYDKAIKEKSKETGPHDRLSCRLQAAREIIAEMSLEDKEALDTR
ncbi:hypothetical protein PQX77_013247 [Marasmius sp. AFHP31]|nr:hypothetical protein PQX77_013247 [Marasmius sp. AFHP31]